MRQVQKPRTFSSGEQVLGFAACVFAAMQLRSSRVVGG
jgi:hypothetical protein